MILCENDDILKIVNNNSSIHGDPLEKSEKEQYSQLLQCNCNGQLVSRSENLL